jgi:hypothetical protein
MATNFNTTIHANGRQAHLLHLDIQTRLGEPPYNLASTVKVELTMDGSTARRKTSRFAAVLKWLRRDTDAHMLSRQLKGQEIELATLVCWLNGLVPALGDAAARAALMFEVDKAELAPSLLAESFYCCGYIIELWDDKKESLAKQLHVDLATGHVSISKVWQLRNKGPARKAKGPARRS